MTTLTPVPTAPFANLRIRHDRLASLMTDVKSQLAPTGDIVAIMGPTGVGKSLLGAYLVENELTTSAGAMRQNPGFLPALYVEAALSGEEEFSWRLFYQSILEELGDDLSMPRQDYKVDPVSGRLILNRRAPANTLAGLRTAVKNSLKERGVQYLVVDEAAHIFTQTSPRKLLIQLNTLKSLSNTSEVQLILLGSYDLYELLFLSGQLARRIRVIHFSRYREDVDADVHAFKKCVKQFQGEYPELWGTSLVGQTDALMENTLGCIGTLRDVLASAVKIARGRGSWSLDVLKAALLTQEQRNQILKEIQDGELRIEPGTIRELHPPKKRADKSVDQSQPETA